jgi:hypothetical protein
MLVLLCCFFFFNVSAQREHYPRVREEVKITVPKEKLHLYLLVGQSNMAGRGIVEPPDTIGNPRILRLNRKGDWEIAKDPLHFDKPAAGVGPGLSFAREILAAMEDKDVVIGLIPCAAGGSGIDIWEDDLFWQQTKSYPYNDALVRTKLALKDGTLKGILWHQGEADCAPEKTVIYQEKLILLVDHFRKEFESPMVPFIAGEMFSFRNNGVGLNKELHQAKNRISHYDVVSGKDLSALPDGVHLDAKSARELGKRYARMMITYINE